MLADYVMKSIDSLFTDKLNGRELTQRTKKNSGFDKEIIKKSLHKVIKKDHTSQTSPLHRNHQSISPVSKSKLRTFLENNKQEKIKSVLKGQQASIEQENCVGSTISGTKSRADHLLNKENNVVRYYQEMRKSIQKSQERSKSTRRGLQLSKNPSFNATLKRNASKRDTRPIRS